MTSRESGSGNNRAKKLSYWIWALIVAGNVIRVDFLDWHCTNNSLVYCTHIDFANLIFGGIAAILIVFNWSVLTTSKDLHPKWKWSSWAALAACITLLFKGIYGGGCVCTANPFLDYPF